MKILIVRHAIAEDISPTGRDEDRPLSPEGSEKFNQVCKKLSSLNWKFDLLLDSPLIRSQQTADIFCNYFSVTKRKISHQLEPLADVSYLFQELKNYNKDFIVIVGHQPNLGRFINFCLTTDKSIAVSLKRGGMVLLDFPPDIQPGTAIMKALLAPRFLINE